MPPTTKLTVELGVLVPYPEEVREAKDQRRPSALRKQTKELDPYMRLTTQTTTSRTESLMIDSVLTIKSAYLAYPPPTTTHIFWPFFSPGPSSVTPLAVWPMRNNRTQFSSHLISFISTSCHHWRCIVTQQKHNWTKTRQKQAVCWEQCLMAPRRVSQRLCCSVCVCLSTADLKNHPIDNSAQLWRGCTCALRYEDKRIPTCEKKRRKSGQVRLVRSCVGCPRGCFLLKRI